MAIDKKTYRNPETLLTHAGRSPHEFFGFINPPVVHASTVLFADARKMQHEDQPYNYGRRGTPTSDAMEAAMCALENGHCCKLTPSGLNAVTIACMSVLQNGDHFLITDSVYGPTRHFCDTVLRRMGVTCQYYPPTIGADISRFFQKNTRAVLIEAPGSLTFEMPDIGAIIEACKAAGAYSIMDNTWATPLYFKPLDHGVDLSIQAATKYICGHSDVMIGTVVANERSADLLADTHGALGIHVAPDDIYLALRGLRTMGLRLDAHMQNGLVIAKWLQENKYVARLRHPALKDDEGHALWARDFSGASGLFAFDLHESFTDDDADEFLNALQLFGIGYSWGGYESLATRAKLTGQRSCTSYGAGAIIRLHVGLEAIEDIKADLSRGFAALEKRAG